MKDRYEADLAVVGGGTAGAICAVEAGALGLKTILIERTGQLGGVGCHGLMGSFANLMVDTMGKPLLGGKPRELMERLVQAGGIPYPSFKEAVLGRIGSPFTIPYQPVYYEKALFDMVEAYGVSLFLNTGFYGGQEIGDGRELWLAHGGRTFRASAKVVVDATGNAQVAAAFGAPVKNKASSHGRLMRIGQVDIEKTLAYLWETRPWEPDPSYGAWLRGKLGLLAGQPVGRAGHLLDPFCYYHAPKKKEGDWQLGEERIQYIKDRWEREQVIYTLELNLFRHLIRKAADQGDFILDQPVGLGQGVTFNGDGIAYGPWGTGVALCNVAKPYGFHSVDVEEETMAGMLACRYNFHVFGFLKKYVPGFGQGQLLDMGSQAVSRCDQMIEGCDMVPEEEDRPLYHQPIYLFGGIYEHQPGVPVPYGKILPQALENLFVVGKGSSQGNRYRSQLSCMAMGTAAAAGAKVVLDTGRPSHSIEPARLKAQLALMGVILEKEGSSYP